MNRLARQTSPYLLQHKDNPVDWYPWGDEAFSKALEHNKPVFLSVGYSTCHWCHVMAHESFEDEEVAALLNEHFVSIKVDREERPDVDHVYTQYCQLVTGHAGWPLTVFMTPQKQPFYAGTYFPKTRAFGRIGLIEVLEQIAQRWAEEAQELTRAAEEHHVILERSFSGDDKTTEGITDADLHRVYDDLVTSYDGTWGGFGRAPKFPQPHNLLFLFRYHRWQGEPKALEMALKTLDAMSKGGIHDHLCGGFSRYSTDRRWLIPHFEKMLYDNALLLMAYAEAYQITGADTYKAIAYKTIGYISRDMTSSEGAFFSAEDADSDGVEGKFYVWTPDEVEDVLGPESAKEFCDVYGVTSKGNFDNKSILNLIGKDTDIGSGKFEAELERLLEARNKRVRPHLDDKILTSWNALMIAALCICARAFDDRTLLSKATRAAESVLARLRRDDGRLLASHRNGEAGVPAYLADYSSFIWALIEIHQTGFDPKWLFLAEQLQDQQNELFWDQEHGGYFFYGKDAEQLIVRPKEDYDGALPSGNSIAAGNLIRLHRLLGRSDLLDRAGELFAAFGGATHATARAHLMSQRLMLLAPQTDVVVTSALKEAELFGALRPLYRVFAPNTNYLYLLEGEDYERLKSAVPFLKGTKIGNEDPTFYACKDFACSLPTGCIEKILQKL